MPGLAPHQDKSATAANGQNLSNYEARSSNFTCSCCTRLYRPLLGFKLLHWIASPDESWNELAGGVDEAAMMRDAGAEAPAVLTTERATDDLEEEEACDEDDD